MKQLIKIAFLLCLSVMTFKTEAEEINEIKDKDFLEFFKEFQKDLEESKGQIYYFDYIDYSAIKKQSKSVKDFVDNHFNACISFIDDVKRYYEFILKLSPLNKFKIAIDGYDETGKVILFEASCYGISVIKNKNNQYSLLLNYYDHDGEFWSVGCKFAKINNGWHKWGIIDFYWDDFYWLYN